MPRAVPPAARGVSRSLSNAATLPRSASTPAEVTTYLATVFAPWLLFQINQAKLPVPPIFSVLTFAAPTAGNVAFAKQFDASFRNSWRYYNQLDLVPRASAAVSSIGDLFPPPAPAASSIETVIDGETVTLAEGFEGAALLIGASEIYNGNSFYGHTNLDRGSVELNLQGEIFPVTSTDPLLAWFEQAGAQHAHNHYLDFLGGANVTCDQSATDVEFGGK